MTIRKSLILNILAIISILAIFVFMPVKFIIYKLLVIYAVIGGILFFKVKINLLSDFEKSLGFASTWIVYIWIITLLLILGTLFYRGCF
ncbi:MAG: hypothetical protein AB1638_05500 [Nitrospirota bacterium]